MYDSVCIEDSTHVISKQRMLEHHPRAGPLTGRPPPKGAVMGADHTGPSAAELLDDLLASDDEIADFLNQLAHLAALELTDELPVLVGITLERDRRSTKIGRASCREGAWNTRA